MGPAGSVSVSVEGGVIGVGVDFVGVVGCACGVVNGGAEVDLVLVASVVGDVGDEGATGGADGGAVTARGGTGGGGRVCDFRICVRNHGGGGGVGVLQATIRFKL